MVIIKSATVPSSYIGIRQSSLLLRMIASWGRRKAWVLAETGRYNVTALSVVGAPSAIVCLPALGKTGEGKIQEVGLSTPLSTSLNFNVQHCVSHS